MSSRSVLVCKRILAADDPVLDCVERTYNDSFPEVERRDFSLVRQLIANEPDFQMYVFLRDRSFSAQWRHWQRGVEDLPRDVGRSPRLRGGASRQ